MVISIHQQYLLRRALELTLYRSLFGIRAGMDDYVLRSYIRVVNPKHLTAITP